MARDEAAQLQIAEDFVAKGAWVSHLVLAETLWILDAVFERTAEQIATAVDMLLNHKNLVIQDADVIAALENYRKRPSLGFSDCLVLEIARKAGHLPMGTFDRTLAKLDGVNLL